MKIAEPKPLLPLLPERLHLHPTSPAQVFKVLTDLLLLTALVLASFAVPQTDQPLDFRLADSLSARAIGAAPPLGFASSSIIVVYHVELVLEGEGEPYGRAGAEIGPDGVPGGSEPAGDVEG